MSALRPGKHRIAVTGANGFIGAHCVLSLLKAGFQVVAIVRDPNNKAKTEFLEQHASQLETTIQPGQLVFAAGDLLQPGSYDKAFEGCHGVLHTAAVVELASVKDPMNQVVRPSVQGTANVLQSIKKNLSTIQRYVHFSSVAAIQSLDKPQDHVFVDNDWNTWSTIETDAYGYAKTQAEKLVWDDRDLPKSGVDIVVLNPSIVLGPCLCKAHTRTSAFFIREIIYGNPLADNNGSFVDVRDVAMAAVLAFQNSNPAVVGKRFILSATKPSNMLVLNDHVKKSHPWVPGSPPLYSPAVLQLMLVLSNLPLVSSFMPQMTEIQKASFQRLIEFDASQSQTVLGVEYRNIDDTCRDAVDSMKPFLRVSNWGGKQQQLPVRSKL